MTSIMTLTGTILDHIPQPASVDLQKNWQKHSMQVIQFT